MARNQYNSYRGRKPWGRRILIAIVVILVIALLLAIGAYFFLRDRVIYTDHGPQLVLPFGRESAAPAYTPSGAQTPEEPDDGLVVEPPEETPAAEPEATPAPKPDLTVFARRDLPLGLVPAAEEGPGERQGFLYDVTDLDMGSDRTAEIQRNRSIRYAAAWLAPDWGAADGEELAARCVELAARGYDEIIFSSWTPADDGAAPAGLYRTVKAALEDAGWQGRLGLDLDLGLFDGYSDQLIPTVAQTFERLYFRHTLQGYQRQMLIDNGFAANGYTVVTVVRNAAALNYSWAILPQQS